MKHPTRVVSLAVLAAMGAAALAGCGRDSQSKLAEATDKARRQFDAACTYLRDPAFQIGEKILPPETISGAVPTDPNVVKLLPRETMNPAAWKTIVEAEKTLSEALAAASNPAPFERVRAETLLARIYSLKADHRAIEAAHARDRAWGTLRELEHAAIEMADIGKRIATADAVLGVTDQSLDEMAAKAQSDQSAAAGRIDENKQKIDKVTAERAATEAANEKLLTEARALRVQSQLAGVIKGVELFDQARVKEDEAAENTAKITEAEDTVQDLRSEMATLEMDVAAAKERGASAEKIAAARKERRDALRTKRQEFVDLLAESQKKVEALAGKLAETTAQAAADEADALAANAKADEYFKKATQDPAMVSPAVTAMHGDVLMAAADVRIRSLELQKRITSVVELVGRLWSALPVSNTVPPVIAKAGSYVKDVAKTTEAAESDLTWAARDYEAAMKRVSEQNQWVYQLQVAAAFAELYKLSGKDEAREKALAALQGVSREAQSVYVAPQVKFLNGVLGSTLAPPATP